MPVADPARPGALAPNVPMPPRAVIAHRDEFLAPSFAIQLADALVK